MSESTSISEEDSLSQYATACTRSVREAHLFVSERDFATIGIERLVSLWRDAGLREFETLSCQETGAVVQVEVERRLPRDQLSAVDCVDRWTYVSNGKQTHLYVIEFTAPKFPPSFATRADDLVGFCDPGLQDHGLTMTLVGPQEAISNTVDQYENAGLSPALQKFGPYKGRRSPLDSLTERQREVLKTADEMGYYAVPRNAVVEDIATELNLRPSTVTEHLQRAERHLVAEYLRR